MADFSVVFDPMLDKERAEFDNGSGGSGGSSYVGGERINIAGGTISFVNSADIVNVTGTSVTLQPNTAYKIYATSQAITLNANPPAAGKWAYEGHLEIFVAGTGYVVTGTNVVLANALEPDAVNNCTVRFHDGIAIIAVEDHVAGYIVVNGSTAGSGSLYYGITTSTNDYVAFDASLNGTTIPLAGAVAEGEKHLVGNGYTETAITGAVDCGTSKFTVANLALSDVQIVGGTMTLGDAYIPSGSTVAVSGGGLAVEKVTGDGGVIDLGGTRVIASSVAIAGATITSAGNQSSVLESILVKGSFVASNCTFSGNNPNVGGACRVSSGQAILDGCNIHDNPIPFNQPGRGAGAAIDTGASLLVSNCTFGENQWISFFTSGGSLTIKGSNTVFGVNTFSDSTPGTVTVTSGAILDLTGNSNPTPINPGGGITFESGGATVKVGNATASSSYMMDNVVLPAGAKLTNTAVVDLSGTHIASLSPVYASGCTFTSGYGQYGGAFHLNANANLVACEVTANTASNPYFGGGMAIGANATCKLSDCVVNGNGGYFTSGGPFVSGDFLVGTNATLALNGGNTVGIIYNGHLVTVSGSNTIKSIESRVDGGDHSGTVTITSGASINLTSSINPGGGIEVVGGTCTVNGNAIPAGTYTSIDSTGTPT